MDTKVSPGEAVNWIVFWNGCHAHYSAEYGRSANELKGMEVKPRAEDPGEVPEEPDLANMSAKERETATAEHKMALDRYWRMYNIFAPQKEKLLDAKNTIVQDLLTTKVEFVVKQSLEDEKGADVLYAD